MPSNNQSNADIDKTIRELVSVLQDSRKALDTQMLDFKIELREQALRLENMRKDIERAYISRIEYEPRLTYVDKKINEYDTILRDATKSRDEFIAWKSKMDGVSTELDELEGRLDASPGKIIQYIAIGISIVGFIVTIIGKVHIG